MIEDGEAEVIGDGRLIRSLDPGDGFGEIALLHDTVQTATVRARTPFRLYTLDGRHFLSAVTGYESSEREAGCPRARPAHGVQSRTLRGSVTERPRYSRIRRTIARIGGAHRRHVGG